MLLIGIGEDSEGKFLRWFLKSLGTSLGVPGVLSQPPVMIGFFRRVILVTYGVHYIAMQAVSLVYFLARSVASNGMCSSKGTRLIQNFSYMSQ